MQEIKGHNFHIPWTFLQCSSIKLHEANQPAPGKSVDCFSYLHNTFNENKPLSCQEEQFTGYCNKSGRSSFKKCRWSSLFINRWNGQQEFKTPPCKDIFPSVYVLSSPWDLPDVLEILSHQKFLYRLVRRICCGWYKWCLKFEVQGSFKARALSCFLRFLQ